MEEELKEKKNKRCVKDEIIGGEEENLKSQKGRGMWRKRKQKEDEKEEEKTKKKGGMTEKNKTS
jgi:hypothetical protein